MIFYKCDQCKKELGGKPNIVLTGYVRKHDGGILLPGQFHEKHFCSDKCFEKWMAESFRSNSEYSFEDGCPVCGSRI
jgi:DNA-directed RNA polymerase subunit RPC12/RpoP